MINKKLKQELSGKIMLFIAVISFVLNLIIGGIIGDSFALLGFLLLIFGIIKLDKEMKEKKIGIIKFRK